MKHREKQRKQFVVLLVCIVTGFIVGYSYNLTKDEEKEEGNNVFYQTSNTYQEELITQQERNNELLDELTALENQIRNYEQQFKSTTDEEYQQQLKEAEQIRLLLGDLASDGEGVRITLKDGDFDGNSNPNNYVVHESHIFSLIQELKISGAEAISVNGQRLKYNSYISCNGPVITVDGKQYPAPFVIEAVGNSNTLLKALEIPGGLIDQLLGDNVVVELSKEQEIKMPATGMRNS